MPSYSTGFCVANTVKFAGRSWFSPSMVTWRSFIASSRDDWTLGEVRLISSASTKLENTGPATNSKSLVWAR